MGGRINPKQLKQSGATSGEVLKWDGDAWGPGAVDSHIRTGLNTTGFYSGDVVYETGSGLAKTDAREEDKAYVFGVFGGDSGKVITGGIIEGVNFTSDGGRPNNGDLVYVALGSEDGYTGTGKLTASPPTTDGNFLAIVGRCADNSNYDVQKKCDILLDRRHLIAL